MRTSKLPHHITRCYYITNSRQMWGFVNSLQEVMSSLTKFAENNQEKVKELLKKPPGK